MHKDIKKVLIYLRKSRGDEENALENHRNRLTTLCEDEKWQYDIFEEEITSGERLADRPVMRKVLKTLENNNKDKNYNGIVVAHYDRLSRGNSKILE